MNLNILHISNDYAGSSVYKNLVQELDSLGIGQIVYTPVKKASSMRKNEINLKTEGSKIIYSNIINKWFHRLFYRLKIKKIFKDVESKVNISQIDLIHAHTWYSDGGVAYLLNKKYNIPFIITVRNTDINVFQKYLIHERLFARKIIKKANNVILISASYKQRILQLNSLQSIKKELKDKIRLIPNGVDSYWIRHAQKEKNVAKPNRNFNILFIGKFVALKNLRLLQEAIILLNKENKIRVKLHIVGGGGSQTHAVLKTIDQYPDLFKYYGKIYDKKQLLQVFQRCDIFAMPSKRETFGLVYVEAMLQGLPILYTQGEGIDDYYREKIGEKVQDFSVEEIKRKLQKMMDEYLHYTIPTNKLIQNHDWSSLAKTYLSFYNFNLVSNDNTRRYA